MQEEQTYRGLQNIQSSEFVGAERNHGALSLACKPKSQDRQTTMSRGGRDLLQQQICWRGFRIFRKEQDL